MDSIERMRDRDFSVLLRANAGEKRSGKFSCSRSITAAHEATVDKHGIRRIARLLGVFLLALVIHSAHCDAGDLANLRDNVEQNNPVNMNGMLLWLKVRYSDSELARLQTGDLRVESYQCGCYDKPVKHFPYLIVLLRTPKGDLIARPENREVTVSLTPLAVRYGTRYCDVDSEECYGSFSQVCDFTDFRYGPYLEKFFPTCKSADAPPVIAGESLPTHLE
jgi:hypothetical protein